VRSSVRLIAACAALLCASAAWAQANLVEVIEFYNAGLDHYFISSLADDIQALDSGRFAGWVRTGLSFMAYGAATPGTNPVCRFYIPPAQGDSHFYSASPAECADVRTKFPTFDYESAAVMYVALPDQTTGACGPGLAPVYRLWNQRADSNHRYTTDVNVRASMIARGYLPEGYGPGVTMCVVPVISFDVSVSADSVLLMPGGSRDVYITVTPHGGAPGAMSIAVSGLPAGATSQLSPASLNVGQSATSALLHLAADGSAQPTSKAMVTVSVTNSGGKNVPVTFSLGIAAAGDPVATKLAAIAAVEAQSIQASAQQPSPLDFAQSIAAFMSTRPEYVASGVDVDTLSAWGRFGDGTGHIVTSNRIPDANAASGLRAQAAAKADGSEFPQSNRARLLQSFGDNFDSSVLASTQMASYFKSKDWTPSSGSTADVAALQVVNGDGFFYFNTHGGRQGVTDPSEPDGKIYAVQSSTVVNDGWEAAFADDLTNLRLVHFTAPQSNLDVPTPGGPPVSIPLLFDTRYGITYRFVQKYMSFAPHSVVWMNACFSSRNQPFISSFLSKGAAVYFGWSELLSPDAAFKSAPYFVDRMLGANKHPDKETPPQRAFPYDLVLQDMAQKNPPLDTDSKTQGRLSATANASGYAIIFAPSIRRAWVSEPDGSIHLEGDFSSDPSAALVVTVGGTQLQVTSLAANEIIAQLPGPTTSGDVVVEIGGVKSNARQLTEWSIPVTYTWDPALFNGWKMQGSGTVRLRADIAGYREAPGGQLKYLYRGGPATQDSSLQITGSGAYTDSGGCTATLSGTQNFQSIFGGGAATLIFLDAEFGIAGDTRSGALSLLFGAGTLSGDFVETYSGNCTIPPDKVPPTPGVQDGAVPIPSGQNDDAVVTTRPLGLQLLLDANYAIPGATKSSLPAAGVTGAGKVVYSWPAVPASTPPRDTEDAGK